MNTTSVMRHRLLGFMGAVLLLVMTGAAHATSTSTVTYVYTDPQGTPLAEADANGNITATFDYAPYGSQAMGTPPSGPGYTGHVNDPESGLVYMQARYYDPAVGRFLSVDPVAPTVGNPFNFSRYAYATNNPIVNIDPDGREAGPAYRAIWLAEQGRSSGPEASPEMISAGVGLIPVVGDVQNIHDAIVDPSALNVTIAVIGAIPEVGGLAAKSLKEVGEVVKSARRVGDFTRAEKNAAKAESAVANGGKMACADCGKEVQSLASQKGVPTPSNQAHVHHDPAIKNGGGRDSKAIVLCPPCHQERHN